MTRLMVRKMISRIYGEENDDEENGEENDDEDIGEENDDEDDYGGSRRMITRMMMVG